MNTKAQRLGVYREKILCVFASLRDTMNTGARSREAHREKNTPCILASLHDTMNTGVQSREAHREKNTLCISASLRDTMNTEARSREAHREKKTLCAFASLRDTMNTEAQSREAHSEKNTLCISASLRDTMNTKSQKLEVNRENKNPPVPASLREIKEKKLRGLRVSFSLCSLFSLLLFSCKNEAYEKQVKSLDSISGAVNQKLAELKLADTVTLRKAIARYTNYRQFIQQNIQDTINKNEANSLQQFYSGGKSLVDFEANRKSLLARGNLLNSQLGKLITDAKENNLDEEQLNQFAMQEKTEADKLIKNCMEQQQLFNASLQEFKLSLSGVEDLVKSRNNGQLPTIVKEQAEL